MTADIFAYKHAYLSDIIEVWKWQQALFAYKHAYCGDITEAWN